MEYELFVFWWGIAGILLFLEIITPMTVFVFPAIVAVLISFLALVVDNIFLQGTVFFLLSAICLFLIRPLFINSKKDPGYKQGGEALIGKKVRVIQKIDNYTGEGRINHASDVFPAKSVDGSLFAKDQWVIIDRVEGITVFVKTIY